MAHESFETRPSPRAQRDFVPIKVDREERPDVDRVYMTFVQATTGSRRLADERVADAGAEAVLRRHVFSAGVALGAARLRETCCSRWRGCGARSAGRVERVGGDASRSDCASAGAAGPRSRCAGPSALDARDAGFASSLRLAARRLRRRAEVPAADPSCCSCCASTRAPATRAARDGRAHAARDGARRHARPRRRRLSPLLGGRRVARAALREDALRPGAARARVSRGRAQARATRSTPGSPRTRCGTCSAR